MSYYPRASPAWTLEEEIMLVYFCAKGFEVPDVARIRAGRLHRGPRTPGALLRLMEWINRVQEQHRLPRLCEPFMLNWDQDAVQNHLLSLTDNTNLLQNLLWFHVSRYVPLLRTVSLGSNLCWHFSC